MPKLLNRLTSQLKKKGVKGAEGMAIALLRKRGQMSKSSTSLTSTGKKRQKMGAAGRAKDRARKANGGKTSDYVYSKKTNRARKK